MKTVKKRMIEKKSKFLEWLANNPGNFDEYTIGSTLGLSREETNQLLIHLVQEDKIIKERNGLCNYKIVKVQ